MRPFPVVLSAPSGGGKTTIAKRLLATRTDVGYSTSCTTRLPRDGEVDGRDYHFWSPQRFEEALNRGEFAEHAEVHGRRYGTLRSEIERVLGSGRHVILDIDVQGAAQLAQVYADAVLVFILPPAADALLSRLGGRGSEDPGALRLRLRNASEELLQVGKYDYVVVNRELEAAVASVGSIIEAEALRRVRFAGLDDFVATLRSDLERIRS